MLNEDLIEMEKHLPSHMRSKADLMDKSKMRAEMQLGKCNSPLSNINKQSFAKGSYLNPMSAYFALNPPSL